MTSAVAGLLKGLFPSKLDEGRLLCVGLDAAGRTSWLYKKLLGEVVTTIPTVGFNVETINHNGCSFTIWDVGGCDKIRPLWRHYFQDTHGIVLFVDANDRDRLDEVAEEVRWLMSAEELRDAFCLVIANKQDLPWALSASQVSERLQLPELLKDHFWTCLPGCLHETQYFRAQFDWLASALRHRSQLKSRNPGPAGGTSSGGAAAAAAAGGQAAPAPSGSDPAGGGGGREPDILERWLQVEDEPDDEFLRKLEDFSLDSWDHRTHLRLAWLYLRRHGRREGLARIHASIRAFIANSPVTRRKTGTTYHETMTYFWAHMVHFAMESMRVPPGATDDFKLFLLLNPQLTNGGLFLHYYTKKLMLDSPEARVQVVLPDKRPLPSIVTDISALSLKQGGQGRQNPAGASASATPPGPLSDAEFLQRFLTRTLDKWNHECLLRAVYCCLKQHGRQRGGPVALDGLRGLQKEAFHLTINYFWLCMMTHTLVSEFAEALFPPQRTGGGGADGSVSQGDGTKTEPEAASTRLAAVAPAVTACAKPAGAAVVAVEKEGSAAVEGVGVQSPCRKPMPEWPVLMASSSYTAARLKELVADDQRYLRHYSKGVIFSDEAAAQFVPPDKRPLPSTA